MTLLPKRTLVLTAVIALVSLISSGPAFSAVLRTSSGNAVVTKDGAAVLVEDSADSNCVQPPVQTPPAKPVVLEERNEHVYFDSNKSDLTRHAKHTLRHLAAKLRGSGEQIVVVGYTDSMGNAAYNEKLALKRAKAVRDFLVGNGVKAKKIEVRSRGNSAASANCAANLSRAAKIDCLREDRRVEIEAK